MGEPPLRPDSEDFRRLAPFRQLVEVVAALRGEGGCPWDRAQDHHSMKRFLQEEAHEVLEALEEEDPERLREELGDLLFQVVFHARLAQEQGRFDADAVCLAIVAKMVRRHPHVFGSPEAAGEPRDWERLKLRESAARQSLLDGIPRDLPALLRAQRVASRVAQAGFAWPDLASALGKVREELAEVESALEAGDAAHVEAEFGDLLFAIVAAAAMAGADAEAGLRGSLRRFGERFRALEERLGPDMEEMDPGEILVRWREIRRGGREES